MMEHSSSLTKSPNSLNEQEIREFPLEFLGIGRMGVAFYATRSHLGGVSALLQQTRGLLLVVNVVAARHAPA